MLGAETVQNIELLDEKIGTFALTGTKLRSVDLKFMGGVIGGTGGCVKMDRGM